MTGRLQTGAIAVTTLVTVLVLASLWFAPQPDNGLWVVIWELVVGAGLGAAGCTIMIAVPEAPTGRLFVVAGLMLLTAPLLSAAGAPDAGNTVAVTALAVVLPPAMLRIVADRPLPRLMRLVDVLVVVSGVVCAVATAAQNIVVGILATTASCVVLFSGGWLLFEATSGDDRRRVLWVILGVSTSVPTGLLFLVAADSFPVSALVVWIVLAALSLMLPLFTGIALIAPRSADVRNVIRHTAVLAVMLALSIAAYEGVHALIAAAIATGFQPARLRVQESMDELLFGGRADPVETLARLGPHLTAGSAPPEWLDTLRIALAVPGVVLRQDGQDIASSGRIDHAETAVTPLQAGAEHVGDLVVTLPAEQLRLPPTTSAVLGLVAGPLAQALHAARLSEQLRASRGRVVTALEEERRRIRRDLHDGLGPTLTGIAYSADAAANFVHADPEQAVETLRHLRADAGEAIAEVRRIVDGLRPRALDELGLVGAIRQRISHLRAAEGRHLDIDVVVPDELPDLPAAVEVVAYRVAIEAVTNVARHANVNAATVDFTLVKGSSLRVTVRDPGRSDRPWRQGVGLTTMRERVEQIGGTFTATNGRDGATITANLPLHLPALPLTDAGA